jgi:hypothetical protein
MPDVRSAALLLSLLPVMRWTPSFFREGTLKAMTRPLVNCLACAWAPLSRARRFRRKFLKAFRGVSQLSASRTGKK